LEEWADYEYKGEIIVAKIIGVDQSGRLQLNSKTGNHFSADLKEIIFLHEP
jgi:hypothetical protein